MYRRTFPYFQSGLSWHRTTVKFQTITFTQDKKDKTAEKRNHSGTKESLYIINVTATDSAGNTGTVTRNVIFKSTNHDDHGDDD